ncbi:MAG: hypothetical protein ACI9H6_000145 [Patiriisocius sp.]|jgi:hypothetical protein
MKRKFLIYIDICILIVVWLLFILSFGYLSVVNLYFPSLEIAGNIAIISTLLLAVSYTIFWVKRFRKSLRK